MKYTNIKRAIALGISVVSVLSLTSCGSKVEANETVVNTNSTVESLAHTEAPVVTEAPEPTEAPTAVPTEAPTPEPTETPSPLCAENIIDNGDGTYSYTNDFLEAVSTFPYFEGCTYQEITDELNRMGFGPYFIAAPNSMCIEESLMDTDSMGSLKDNNISEGIVYTDIPSDNEAKINGEISAEDLQPGNGNTGSNSNTQSSGGNTSGTDKVNPSTPSGGSNSSSSGTDKTDPTPQQPQTPQQQKPQEEQQIEQVEPVVDPMKPNPNNGGIQLEFEDPSGGEYTGGTVDWSQNN